MSVRIDIDIANASKAIKKIKSWEIAKKDAIKNAVNESALNVQKTAKRLCPVDTGRLRASIAMEPYNGGLTMVIGSKVNYAKHVEFGTRKMAGKAFLHPAWEEEKPEFLKALKGVLQK